MDATGTHSQMSTQTEPGALEGVRVVELAQVVAGPYAASLLGDMGADVIKADPPDGEPFRTIDRIYGPTDSAYFFAMNRSKRGLALDLKSPEGKAVLRRLLAQTDVFIVPMRPAALSRLGLRYDELRRDFPGMVYCMISAFGETGPRAAQPGIDILVQACGGIMGTTGEPGRPPSRSARRSPISRLRFSRASELSPLCASRSRRGWAKR